MSVRVLNTPTIRLQLHPLPPQKKKKTKKQIGADKYMPKVWKSSILAWWILFFKSSKLTIKTRERRHWRSFGVFIVNFEDMQKNNEESSSVG